MSNAAKTTILTLTVLVAVLALAGCDQAPIESDPTVDPPSGPSSTKDPLVGTWVRDDGYTLTFAPDGTFTPPAATTFAWSGHGTWTATDTVVLVQDDGHDVYPATYSIAGDMLTLGPDGPLQEGDYARVSAQ